MKLDDRSKELIELAYFPLQLPEPLQLRGVESLVLSLPLVRRRADPVLAPDRARSR